MLKLSNVAGFDFEKKVVLIKTGKTYRTILSPEIKELYEIETLSDDEMQTIFDAWQKQKSINEGYGIR